MRKRTKPSLFAVRALRALREAVAEAIEEHRRAGRPIVVSRRRKPVAADAGDILAVREPGAKYGSGRAARKARGKS